MTETAQINEQNVALAPFQCRPLHKYEIERYETRQIIILSAFIQKHFSEMPCIIDNTTYIHTWQIESKIICVRSIHFTEDLLYNRH
jgi:hypothetical protein